MEGNSSSLDPLEVSIDPLKCCHLCVEILCHLRLLQNHLKSHDDGKLDLCHCREGIEIKNHLISHLLKFLDDFDFSLNEGSKNSRNLLKNCKEDSLFGNEIPQISDENPEVPVESNEESFKQDPVSIRQDPIKITQNPVTKIRKSQRIKNNDDSNDFFDNKQTTRITFRSLKGTEVSGSSKKSTKNHEKDPDKNEDSLDPEKSIKNFTDNLIKKEHLEEPDKNENLHDPVKLTKTFPCPLCPKTLQTRSGLSKHHKMSHNPSNKFKCPQCDTAHCNTLKNLHAHMRLHKNIKIDEKNCEKCNKKFSTASKFYHHLLLHREKFLICDFCGMKYNMKQPLKKHIFTHLDIKIERKSEKKSLCEICSKWISSSRMRRHLGCHFQELRSANFKCDFEGCTKVFTELRNLQDHQNTHKNLSPYICEFCSVSFKHRAALRQHRLRHLEPEKFKCEICCECFVTNQSLRKHRVRQHREGDLGDVRPFACEEEGCQSTFKYEDFLVRHRKEVHCPKPQIHQKCDHCNYVAFSMKNFFQHMRRAHNIRKRLNNRVFPTSLREFD